MVKFQHQLWKVISECERYRKGRETERADWRRKVEVHLMETHEELGTWGLVAGDLI